jgi:hypothetical protein
MLGFHLHAPRGPFIAPRQLGAVGGQQGSLSDSRLEGGMNRAKLKFTNVSTTTSRVSVRNKTEYVREGGKQIASE